MNVMAVAQVGPVRMRLGLLAAMAFLVTGSIVFALWDDFETRAHGLAAIAMFLLLAVAVGLRVLDGNLDLEPALIVLILAPEAYLPLRRVAAEYDFPFPYLFDEAQETAKAYRAACTPDFFLFDGDRKLVYRGQLDGSRPGNDVAVDGRDLRAALDAVLAGDTVAEDQIPSLGCNIKWKPGNEPSYFG